MVGTTKKLAVAALLLTDSVAPVATFVLQHPDLAVLHKDEAIFQQEMERIFYKGWVYVGHESEIPNPL